jgi:hypothetical protein
MRDAFRLLAEFENIPTDVDTIYWEMLVNKAAQMARKWQNDPLAVNLAIGVIDGLQGHYKAKEKQHQMSFATA